MHIYDLSDKPELGCVLCSKLTNAGINWNSKTLGLPQCAQGGTI